MKGSGDGNLRGKNGSKSGVLFIPASFLLETS